MRVNEDGSRLQWQRGSGEIVAASTKVGFLGYGRALANFDVIQTIGVGAIPESAVVVQREIPRDSEF